MATSQVGQQSLVIPAPTVKILHNSTFGQDPVKIEYMDSSNTTVGTYGLHRYPVVTAQDVTPTMIAKGLYVEMAHYRRSMSRYQAGKGGGYVVPAPWDGAINPLDNGWTRGGIHTDHSGNPLPRRPNHYQVTAVNEQVPVFEYLHNRHTMLDVAYRDTTGNGTTVELLVPSHRRNINAKYFGKTFMYSSMYTPYYFRFRYVIGTPGTFVSGPWSNTIKLAYRYHPFKVDPVASATLGLQVGDIGKNFDPVYMNCWFETRLP